MKVQHLAILGTVAISMANLTSQVAVAQTAPPTANQGYSSKLIGTLNLNGQLTEIGDRQLRVRLVTLEPGGTIVLHNHKDRPSVEMLIKGTATEYRQNVPKEYKEGEAMIADVETVHSWKNNSNAPAVIVAADIFNPPK